MMLKKGHSNARPQCSDRLAIRIYSSPNMTSGKVGTLSGRNYSHLEMPTTMATIEGKGHWLKNAAAKMKRNDDGSASDFQATEHDDITDGAREEEPKTEINVDATKPNWWISRFWTRNKTQPLTEEEKIEGLDSKERHFMAESSGNDKLASIIEETETDIMHGCNGKLQEMT